MRLIEIDSAGTDDALLETHVARAVGGPKLVRPCDVSDRRSLPRAI
jgi:hypothetical protein